MSTDEDLISYYNNRAEEALDSSEYAENDDELERCMSEYFEARRMADMVAFMENTDEP